MPRYRFIKSQFENRAAQPAQNHAPQKTALALSVCKTAPLARKIRSSLKSRCAVSLPSRAAPRADKVTARAKCNATRAKIKSAACKIKPQHSKASLSFWNSDLLPRIDEVRVFDNLAVGVENNLVFIRVAVEFLRDFR